MDAKITKQRLGNLLAYDWLKILAAIVAAAVVLSLFFTMVRTRPTEGQKFEIHAYTDVSAGVKFNRLSDDLLEKNAFSYDILAVSQESFTVSGSAAGQVYTARRAAGEGSVLFISDLPKYDDEGKLTQESMLKTMSEGTLSTEKGKGSFYDARYYMQCCREYLEDFFGENLEGELDEEAAEESFLSRNSGDKRFRSSANRAKGIEQEKERLELLRKDYLVVQASLESESGGLAYREVDYGKEGEPDLGCPAFDVSGLGKISEVCYYIDGEEPATEKLSLMLYHNDYGKGNALHYDTLSFLRYLVENYA